MSTSAHLPLQAYCRQLTVLFQRAISHQNPAMWLYKNDTRGLLFMAESLARVLAGTVHKKKMEKASILFKKLEDILGEIDDCDHLAKLFATHATVRKDEVAYFIKKRDKALEKLNQKLIKKEFYQQAFHKVYELADINFNNKDTVVKLHGHLMDEMETCFDFYELYNKGFTDMESQVHEIRRKLRWFSIYGRSFDGTIVLEKNKTAYSWEKKFISAKDLKSSYNKLLTHKHLQVHIVFDQKAFYALNTVIERLGTIKNKSIALEALAKAIRKTRKVAKEEAETLAAKQLHADYSQTSLLQEAQVLLYDFFQVYGIHRIMIQ